MGQRNYGGETADERIERRRHELADAAFALVADGGWRALSIEAVCRAAALNKRYFYASFESLDALIGFVTARLAADGIAATLPALGGPDRPVEDAVADGVDALVTHLTDDPRRARVLFGAVPAGDAAAGHRAAAIREVIATVAAQGRSRHALDDDPIVETTAAMLVGGTSQAVLDWLDGRIDCSRERFVADLAALWLMVSDGVALAQGGVQVGDGLRDRR